MWPGGKGGCSSRGLTYRDTVRSRAVNIAILFQSIPQLKERYQHDSHYGILGNCDFSVFMGTTDLMTAEFISKRAGTASIVVETEMEEHNKFEPTHFTAQRRESQGVGKRELLTPDEVLTLGKDQPMTEIIIMRDQPVLICEKFDYKRDPESEKWEPFAMRDFNPTDSFWFDEGEAPGDLQPDLPSPADPQPVQPEPEAPGPSAAPEAPAGSVPQREQAPAPAPSTPAAPPQPKPDPIPAAPTPEPEEPAPAQDNGYAPTDYVDLLVRDMEIAVDPITGEVQSMQKKKRPGTAYKNNDTII